MRLNEFADPKTYASPADDTKMVACVWAIMTLKVTAQ